MTIDPSKVTWEVVYSQRLNKEGDPVGERVKVSFTCPQCDMTSYHPDDVREGYCGNCHWWTR